MTSVNRRCNPDLDDILYFEATPSFGFPDDYDDVAALKCAIENRAVLVSNDYFRNHFEVNQWNLSPYELDYLDKRTATFDMIPVTCSDGRKKIQFKINKSKCTRKEFLMEKFENIIWGCTIYTGQAKHFRVRLEGSIYLDPKTEDLTNLL